MPGLNKIRSMRRFLFVVPRVLALDLRKRAEQLVGDRDAALDAVLRNGDTLIGNQKAGGKILQNAARTCRRVNAVRHSDHEEIHHFFKDAPEAYLGTEFVVHVRGGQPADVVDHHHSKQRGKPDVRRAKEKCRMSRYRMQACHPAWIYSSNPVSRSREYTAR